MTVPAVDVVLITKPHCEYCELAKLILDRLGAGFAIQVREIGVEEPEGAALALHHGILFAPGILIDGRLAGYGRPSERRLRRLLEARQAR